MDKIMMIRTLAALVAVSALAAPPAHAAKKADYGVNLGFSPFGGSLGLAYHHTKRTTLQVTVGGAPAMDAPFGLELDGDEYTQNGGSAWMGFFVNHRPFAEAKWLRVNTGIGIGNIEGTVTNDDNGDEYAVEFSENPVGYIGLGVGAGTGKGMVYGFDIGGLFTGGPSITPAADNEKNVLEDLEDSAFFGSVLPNVQVTVGYNF
jgi:hypothetical protein